MNIKIENISLIIVAIAASCSEEVVQETISRKNEVEPIEAGSKIEPLQEVKKSDPAVSQALDDLINEAKRKGEKVPVVKPVKKDGYLHFKIPIEE